LLTPAFVIRVFLQWWYIAIPLGAILSCIAAILVFILFTPVYRASAVVQIASRAPYIAYEAEEAPLTTEEFVETQVELLRSPIVIETVLSDSEISEMPEVKEQSNPIDWLVSRVKIDQVGNSELYRVALSDQDADIAAKLVNAIIDAYFNVRSRDDNSRTDRVVQLLQDEKKTRANEVQRLREKMKVLSQETLGRDPFTDLPSGPSDVRHPLQHLQEQYTEAEVSRRMLEVEIQALKEAIDTKATVAVPKVQVEMTLDGSDEIRELRALIALKKNEMHRIEVTSASGRQDPGYRRLEREIATYQRNIDNSAKQARPNVVEQLESIAALDREDALSRLKSQLEAKKSMEVIYKERFEEKLAEISKTGDKSLELEFTRSELAREEQVFKLIAERLMALATEMRAPGRVSILQRADPPRYPVERIPLRNLALAGLASMCLPFAIIVLWELSQRRICDVTQLSKQTPSTVVREVAKIGTARRLGGGKDMRLFEESIDGLRVGLQLNHQSDDNAKVLAVVSAVKGEGKTSVAVQLALSVARATGRPTLLIDGDMRAPDIHEIFELPFGIGLAQVLDDSASVDEAVVTSWSQNVHILPAGRLHKSPHSLIGSGNFEKLLDALRERYSNIIIDTPPILSASEALYIARLADRTVFCTKRNRSRERQVRLAYEHLLAAGVQPGGVVLSAVARRKYSYTYGRYDYST
jgi:capsular exopolysaccharide synthesis family protein